MARLDTTAAAVFVTAAAAALVAGCDGYPYDARADELGPEDPLVSQGPRHRPGQPCLRCHGASYTPGEIEFQVAGTIYRTASDTRGLANAEVIITDAEGDEISVTTNVVGNFAIMPEAGLDAPIETLEGIWRVPGPLPYPLRVKVRFGGLEEEMRGAIHREGSCGACHTGVSSASTVGRVVVIDETD